MFRGGCTASILLDPSPRRFYTTGDVISGVIDLHTSGMYSVTDIQVKLRCDEYSVATYHNESERRREKKEKKKNSGILRPLRQAAQQQAMKQLGKAGNFDEDTIRIMGDGLAMLRERKKHYQLTTNAFSTDNDEEKTMLSSGHHRYPFSFRLSEAIDRCPPHAPISASHGMKIGVFWTVKAVVRRPGRFQADIREVIKVPVYPDNPHRSHIDLSRRKQVIRRSENSVQPQLAAYLTYPEPGIPQDGGPLPLDVEVSTNTKCSVNAKIVLSQTCISRAKGFSETHTDNFELGATTSGIGLAPGSTDLNSSLGPLLLENFIAPTVSLSNVKISYEVLVTIASAKNPVILRLPIAVLSPVDTMPPQYVADKHSKTMPPQYAHGSDGGTSPVSGAPSLPHRRSPKGPSYMIDDKSPYQSVDAKSQHSQSSTSFSTGSSSDTPTEGTSFSGLHSEAATHERQLRPPLPPRTPLEAPSYPEKSSGPSSLFSASSSPTEASRFDKQSPRAHPPDTSLAGPSSTVIAPPNENETWHPRLMSQGSVPPVAASRQDEFPAAFVHPERSARDWNAQVETNATGSTDSTLVGSIEPGPEPDDYPGSPGGLPSYDDAVRRHT